MENDTLVTSNGNMPAKPEIEAAPENLTDDAGPAAAGASAPISNLENGNALKPQNGSGETALDNTTYTTENGTEDMGGEDEPSPITGNDTSGGDGADDIDNNDNDVDLIAVAALAIPQASFPPREDIDISTLPSLSPLITRRDISRRDLPLICHVVGCNLGLGPQAEYYQRYRICKEHLRTAALLVDGVPQRFCQQCGKFHDLDAFDGDKRNCRARLAQHNSRRRKAGAGTAPTTVIPYGQGGNGRKRIPTSFEGFKTDFDYDYAAGGDNRRKRARIPVVKEFPPPPKAQRQQPRASKSRREHDGEEDNGFLDQLLAAATGLEEEEQGAQQQQQQQYNQQQNQYYNNDQDVVEEPYTYDPTATMQHHQTSIASGPVRVTSRPVAPAAPQQYYNGNGRSPIANGVSGGGAPPGYSQFGGWPASAVGTASHGGFNMPPAVVPSHPAHRTPYGVPPGQSGVQGSGAFAVQAAVSELERVMGRQLLQNLMAGAGLGSAVAPPLPPVAQAQPSMQHLFDVIRSMSGGSNAGGASYYPPQPPAGLQPQQAQQAFRPTANYAPPGGAAPISFGGEPAHQDRNSGAQNALDALRKLVSTLPQNSTINSALDEIALPVPVVANPAPEVVNEPIIIKSEPVTTETVLAPSSQQPSPRSGSSLITQLAAALKNQTDATSALLGHQVAAALVETGREPTEATVVSEPNTSGVPSAQQDAVLRGLMAMLENSKSAAAVAAVAQGGQGFARSPLVEPVAPGASPQLLMSLLQREEAAPAATAGVVKTETTPPPET